MKLIELGSKSNTLKAWGYDADLNELYLQWHGSKKIYVYTGDVENFEEDVKIEKSWGKTAYWYVNHSNGVELKSVITPTADYTIVSNRITGEYSFIPA